MHIDPEASTTSLLPAIELSGISVCYRVPRENLSSIKEFTIKWIKKDLKYEEFWALKNIDFSIFPGQVFGILGKNGAGKSTLLKVLARVLLPTSGRVIIRGQVFPLLELGGGFHPDLTGRENVFINGELLGIPRNEIKRRFDEIIDFSEIEEFIDAPIRTYSTGMITRLAFSVATCKRPDILLADEILSVGDVAFQEKCINRIKGFAGNGSTIILVSHSIQTVRSFCSQALWLDHGQIKYLGFAEDVAEHYQNYMHP